jgi:uncharacterized protein YfbU (UPF0304 family)
VVIHRRSIQEIEKDERTRLAKEAEPFGENIQFPGFDGSNESEHFGIARFIIEDLKLFSCFHERRHKLNSHFQILEGYPPKWKWRTG